MITNMDRVPEIPVYLGCKKQMCTARINKSLINSL